MLYFDLSHVICQRLQCNNNKNSAPLGEFLESTFKIFTPGY